ncbi:MAG TPA: hypothetical protein VF459_17770 [Caulobacteraceae bacterium]
MNRPAWLALKWSLTVIGWMGTAAFVLGAVFWLPGQLLPATSQRFFGPGVLLVGTTYACCMSQALRKAAIPMAARMPAVAWALLALLIVLVVVEGARLGWRVVGLGTLAGAGAMALGMLTGVLLTMHGRDLLDRSAPE